MQARLQAVLVTIRELTNIGQQACRPTAASGDTLADVEFALVELADRVGHRRELYDVTQRVAEQNAAQLGRIADRLVNTQGELKEANGALEQRIERRTAELVQANKRLAHSERLTAIGHLAAGVAHEVNNPLFAVIANLEFLQDGLPSNVGTGNGSLDVGEVLAETLDGARRIQRIVRDLSSFSRGDDGSEVGPIDLRVALDSAWGLVRKQVEARAQIVEQRGPIPYVVGSEGRLVQVFVNLLLNAAQAIRAGSPSANTIATRTSTDGLGRAVVEICDTGCGIADAHMPRIFEPFFTTKATGQGSGLGLSVCHGLISGMGGELGAKNREPNGTCFTVTLPGTESPEPLVEPSPPAATFPGPPSGRILIVDDEVTILRALRRSLAPHSVELASSGVLALSLLEKAPGFDIILCDLTMPGLDGAEVFARACSQDPKLGGRFVFMSGGTFSSRMREFVATLDSPVLGKPIDVDHLRQLVAERLSQARAGVDG